MNKFFTLVAMLFAAVLNVAAKGEITVTTSTETLAPGDVATVTVSMSNEEQEVRGLEVAFELPDYLDFYGGSYDNNRFDAFQASLQFNPNTRKGLFTALSLSGAYVQGTKGRVFSFTVKAKGNNDLVKENPDLYNFTMKAEVSYDKGKVDNSKHEVKFTAVQAKPESPVSLFARETEFEVKGEATVDLWYHANSYFVMGGYKMNITLPEGMVFVKDEKGNIDFTYSNSVSENRFPVVIPEGDNKASVAVIEGKSEALLYCNYTEAQFVSFKVKATEKASAEGEIVISDISIADVNGKEYAQKENIVINVTNNNSSAWTAVQASVQDVQDAIDNFDAVIATMPYASRYEGEEITGDVDAARTWVTETLAAYQAKYEAGDLSSDSGVRAEAAAQIEAVNHALSTAAKYDVYRHLQAAVLTWAGDEEDITGYRDGVLALIATLPEAGQSALNEQVVLLEAAMKELMGEYEQMGEYNEDNYKEMVAKCNAITDNVIELVAMANETGAMYDMERLEELQAQMTAAIRDNEEYLTGDDNSIIESFLGDTYPLMIQGAYEACLEEGTVYESPIRWDNLEAILADMCAWMAVNQQVAMVKAAIENYENTVAGFMYASRYEGEELSADVDAAREWAETTLAAKAEKHSDGFLTAEDGVLGEALEQVEKVNMALSNAAKYDVYRYIQAAVNYWAGDEDEFEGRRDAVLALVATLPEAGQSALTEQIDLMEAAFAELLKEYEAYTLYNEDTHNEITGQAEAILASMADIVAEANLAGAQYDMERLEELQAQMTAAIRDNEDYLTPDDISVIESFLGDTYALMIQGAYETCLEEGTVYESPIRWDNLNEILGDMTAWMAIGNQINIVKEALRNYDEIVSTFMFASRYEGEEITELVDGARAWVEAKTAEIGAKHQDGFLTMEDAVLGEAMEQAQNVNEALNLAAMYDAGRYTMAAMGAWYGNDDEDIVGKKEAIMAIAGKLPVAGRSALDERIQAIELIIKDMFDALETYTAYNDEHHAQFIAWYEAVVADIADLIPEANKAAFETDMAMLSQLQKEYITALEYIPEEDRDAEAFAAIDKAIKDLAYAADAQYKALEEGEVYESVVDYDALHAEIAAQTAEYDRQVANTEACYADMLLLMDLQEEWTDYIRGLEPVLSESDVKFTEWLLGDELFMVIAEAYGNVAEEGVYESVIDADAIRAQMAEHAAVIEVARVAYNKKAYEADQKTIARLQNEYNQAVSRIMSLYPGGEDIEAEAAMQQKIYDLSDACDQEYEDKLDAKLYDTPLTDEVLEAMHAAIAKLVEDAKILDSIDGISAGDAVNTIYTINGAKVQNPVRGQLYIIKSKDGVKKIRY